MWLALVERFVFLLQTQSAKKEKLQISLCRKVHTERKLAAYLGELNWAADFYCFLPLGYLKTFPCSSELRMDLLSVLNSFLTVSCHLSPWTWEDFNIWGMRGEAETEQPDCFCCSSTVQKHGLVCPDKRVRGLTLHSFLPLLMKRWIFYSCPLAQTSFVSLSQLAVLFFSCLQSNGGSRSTVKDLRTGADSKQTDKSELLRRRLWDLIWFCCLWPRRRHGWLGSFLLSAESLFYPDSRPSLLIMRPVKLFQFSLD